MPAEAVLMAATIGGSPTKSHGRDYPAALSCRPSAADEAFINLRVPSGRTHSRLAIPNWHTRWKDACRLRDSGASYALQIWYKGQVSP